MLLNAGQIQKVLGKDRIILLAIEDITEHTEKQILQTTERLRKAVGVTIQVMVSAVERKRSFHRRSPDPLCGPCPHHCHRDGAFAGKDRRYPHSQFHP